jgi:hypothetical protein
LPTGSDAARFENVCIIKFRLLDEVGSAIARGRGHLRDIAISAPDASRMGQPRQ